MCIFNNMRGKELTVNEDCEAIELRRNQFVSVPEEVPKTIKHLDISDNLIREIDTAEFKNIEMLDLGYNLLQEHDSIRNETLKELYLMANDISAISESIKYCINLEKFDIATNRLREIENLKFITTNIKEIYLGANKISEFNINLNHLTNLKIVDLQFNNLKEFDCALLPESVDTLLLNNNRNLVTIKNTRKFKIFDYNDTKYAQTNKFS